MTHMTDYDTSKIHYVNRRILKSNFFSSLNLSVILFQSQREQKKTNKASIKMFPSPDHPSIFKRITRDDLSKLRAMRSFSSWVGAERPLAAIAALGLEPGFGDPAV